MWVQGGVPIAAFTKRLLRLLGRSELGSNVEGERLRFVKVN